MKLWNKYKVTSIPSLVFVDAATGKVVCRNGLLVVRDDPKGEDWAGRGQKCPLLIGCIGCRPVIWRWPRPLKQQLVLLPHTLCVVTLNSWWHRSVSGLSLLECKLVWWQFHAGIYSQSPVCFASRGASTLPPPPLKSFSPARRVPEGAWSQPWQVRNYLPSTLGMHTID